MQNSSQLKQLNSPLGLSKSQISNYNIEAIRKDEILFDTAEKNNTKFGYQNQKMEALMNHSFGTPQPKEDSNFKLKYSPILEPYNKQQDNLQNQQESSDLQPKSLFQTPEKQVNDNKQSAVLDSHEKTKYENQIRQIQYKNKYHIQLINNQINQEKQLKKEIEKLESQLNKQKSENANVLQKCDVQVKYFENETRQMLESIGKAQTNLRLQQFEQDVQINVLQNTIRNLQTEYKILEKNLASIKDKSMKV